MHGVIDNSKLSTRVVAKGMKTACSTNFSRGIIHRLSICRHLQPVIWHEIDVRVAVYRYFD